MGRPKYGLVLAIVLSISSVGCGLVSVSPTPTLLLLPTLQSTDIAQGNPTPIPPIPQFDLTPTQSVATPAGPCDHLLWPLVDGATWTYSFTGQDVTKSEIELQSIDSGNGIDLVFGTDSAHLNCVDGALIGMPPGILGSGHPDLGGAVIATNARGSLLASEDTILSMGIPWDLEADPSGTIILPIPDPTPVPVTSGRFVIFSTPSPQESLTVPAGTFMSLPIHQDIYYEITVQMPDSTQKQVLISVGVQEYYVERMGLIKVIFEGGTISTEDSSITANLNSGTSLELLEFSLP